MYFAAAPKYSSGGDYCVGVATSASLVGLYVSPPQAPPLWCEDGSYGFPANSRAVIDPSPFTDPVTGADWLYFKTNDYNGGNSTIKAVKLDPATGDTNLLSGATPSTILNPSQPWQGGVVENPQMVFSNGTYYLLYSGGNWANSTYQEGYASCTNPTSCSDMSIFIQSNSSLIGPGGGSYFMDAHGTPWLAFHSWSFMPSGCSSSSYYGCPNPNPNGSPPYDLRQLDVAPFNLPGPQLHEIYGDSSGWHDGNSLLAGMSSESAVNMNLSGETHAYIYGLEGGALHEIYGDSSGWHDANALLGGMTSVSAVNMGGSHARIYSLEGGYLHEIYADGSGWHDANTLIGGITDISAVNMNLSGETHAYIYALEGGYLYEIYADGSGWHNPNTLIGGITSISAANMGGSHARIYSLEGGYLYEIYADGSGWHNANSLQGPMVFLSAVNMGGTHGEVYSLE